MKSPFKFLDSYTIADREIFFGRDREISELYRRVFESKILLVYGVSGTGKSSLINCGLATRFDDSDWLPVNVRRGNNIIESINDAFNKQAISSFKKNLSVSEKLQSIYLDHFKPVYLIFDQFEELFILGSDDEKAGFIKLIKEVVESDTQCHVIFSIREEFLAGITEFEYDLPEIFSNRFRVEKMKRANAILAVEGPCKVHDIETETGFSEELIDKLCPAGNEIELTFLQIYLDRIFRIAITEKQGSDKLKFSKVILARAGSVSDLLGQFLEEQIREMDDPNTGLTILKSFVSIQGTKRQMNESEILDSIIAFGTVIGEPDLLKYLTRFVDLRILRERDEAGHFELRHDSLASKIYEKFTAIEKDIIEVRQFIENAFSVYEKRGKLLTADDLKYIAPYEDKLYLSKPSEVFINKSKNELTRIRKRRRTFAVAASIALIIVLSGFTIWALNERKIAFKERKTAILNYLKAKANNFNYLSKEIAETDPTVALRLAEYALSIDSSNPAIKMNLNRIYSDNNFYRIVSTHERGILSVAFSPDGKSTLTGSNDKTACLSDLQGNILQVFNGHEADVTSVAFSPDGKNILTGSVDKTARLWDLQGNVLQVFIGHEDVINCVAFSPDGKSLLTGSLDKTARIWDLHGNVLQVFKGNGGAVISAAFSPDGKSILTGSGQKIFFSDSFDRTARLWDLRGNVLQVFRGHEDEIYSVAFSADRRNILTGCVDNTARLWDLRGNVLQVYKGHEAQVISVVFSPNGKFILTGSWDKSARLWDLQGNALQVFKGHGGAVISAAFSPDGKSIITGSWDNTARIWELKGNVLQVFKGHEGSITSVAFSSDGKSILTGSNDKTARLWNRQGRVLQVFKGHGYGINSIAFSPDGKNIITGSWDKTARLWDMQGNVLQVFKGNKEEIYSVAFSPDGKNIITGLNNKSRIWDLQGNVLQVLKCYEDAIYSVAFSPDGKDILTGSDNKNKTAQLWDLQGNLLQVFKGHESYIHSATFSPDGKSILTGSCDNTARLWDLKGNVLQVFKGHKSHIHTIAFSPDGKNILTGSLDNTARIWDLQGNVLQEFKGHENIISSVAFSPDGKSILTGSDDKTAMLWDIKESFKEFQSRNAYQELSIAQKVEYGILEFNDILKLDDEKSINEAAEYYYGEINSAGKDIKTEYINNAINLYDKLDIKFKNTRYSTRKDSLMLIQKD